jgi:hypothetical protein
VGTSDGKNRRSKSGATVPLSPDIHNLALKSVKYIGVFLFLLLSFSCVNNNKMLPFRQYHKYRYFVP